MSYFKFVVSILLLAMAKRGPPKQKDGKKKTKRSPPKRCKPKKEGKSKGGKGGKGAKVKKPYGPRESLTQQQVSHLFGIMVRIGCAWAAVMLLISVSTGERVDAVRQMCTTWLSGLDEHAGRPTITWPRVNQKTTARESILDSGVGKLIWRWIFLAPLGTSQGTSWPFPGQDVRGHLERGTRCLLFPGRARGGQDARSDKAVTARAVNLIWRQCQEVLRTEIAQARQRGESHPFQDVHLSRLSSHCGKKSCINMLQDGGNPISIASALTCTTPSVLQNSYISKAKASDQRDAVQGAMRPVINGVESALEPIFCTKCGLKSASASWAFCPRCGSPFAVERKV